jgi:hypothetical protein
MFFKTFGQEPAPAKHVAVRLHEDMLNSFFKSIGNVSGKGEKSGVKYTWVVVDPKVDLEPGEAKFSARVKLSAGAFETVEKAKGTVSIEYIRETNRIKVLVQEAKVKLHLKLFGKEIPIGTIDLAKYYRPAFEFAGPQPIQNEIEIEMPDNSVRKIKITSQDEELRLEQDCVTVYSNLVFEPLL